MTSALGNLNYIGSGFFLNLSSLSLTAPQKYALFPYANNAYNFTQRK
jgi:hypothetical protein